MRKKYRYFLFVAVLQSLLSGCLGIKHLKENEKLLYRQTIVAPKGFPTEGLTDLYVTHPNSKFLRLPLTPLVWMYYKGLKNYDQKKFIAKRDSSEQKFNRKIAKAKSQKKKNTLQFKKQKKTDAYNVKIDNGNQFMQWGEKIAVFDTTATRSTADRLDAHLFTKGYFLARTNYTITESDRKVTVRYIIHPGPRYFYDSVAYIVYDSVVAAYLEKSKSLELVKKGEPFDQSVLDKERERIDYFLKDRGYYDFSRQYIDYDVDTSYRPGYKVAIRVVVNNPARRDFHKQFRVDSVTFTPDASTTPEGKQTRTSVLYHNIVFNYYPPALYSKKILGQRVFIAKDSLYSRAATLDTQQKLSNLDVFKFVNVNYDTAGGQFIANIFTSPLDRYSWSNEVGLSISQGFPGPYYALTLKKRNIFRGLESFDINGRIGFIGISSPTRLQNYQGSEASLNGTLTFPQFLLPLGNAAGYRLGKFNPKTKLTAGYTYSNRQPDYTRAINTVAATYTWESKKTKFYSFTPINLNVIRSTTDPAFDALLDSLALQGNNLKNSFLPSFVSSMIFSFTWNPVNYGNTKTDSYYLKATAESGGTLYGLYTPTFATKNGLQTYRYVRLTLEYKKMIIMDKNTVVAYRFNSGVAYSYGENKSLPYEKYFFAGGSNGVRAWRPRRLGIGSYPVKLSDNPQKEGLFNYQYEKPGEILLEGSVEVRKKLFGFVSGAIFIDAGNVWTFKSYDPQTSSDYPEWTGNTKFKFDTFYKEFGIGTGFGLRFDFSFLVLRFDAGIKAYDPARAEGSRFILDHAKFWAPYGTTRDPVIYNIGIGYPF